MPGMDTETRPRRDEDDWETRRPHPALTALCIVLALAVIGLAWYAYPRFKQQDASLIQLRDELHDRVQQIKDQASDTSSVQERLRAQAEKIRDDLRARVDSVSKKATQAADDAYRRMEAKLNEEIEARTEGLGGVKDRVANLEAAQSADKTEIAELKQELTEQRVQAGEQAKQLAAEQSQALDEVRRQITDSQNGETQQMTALRRDTDQTRRDLSGISNQLAVEKVQFQASKAHAGMLMPGVSLYVTGTDVANQRMSGRIWLPGEHRNIWLRQQSSLEPVVFYSPEDGQKRELVITNVGKNSVTGYLLLPKSNQPAPLSQAGAGGE